MEAPTSVTKRTYNLPMSTVEEVRTMAQELHVSQDRVVTYAVREYARLQRDVMHAAAWAAAVEDSAFHIEIAAIASEFTGEDLASWEL
jgi:hypothetical protein